MKWKEKIYEPYYFYKVMKKSSKYEKKSQKFNIKQFGRDDIRKNTKLLVTQNSMYIILIFTNFFHFYSFLLILTYFDVFRCILTRMVDKCIHLSKLTLTKIIVILLKSSIFKRHIFIIQTIIMPLLLWLETTLPFPIMYKCCKLIGIKLQMQYQLLGTHGVYIFLSK